MNESPANGSKHAPSLDFIAEQALRLFVRNGYDATPVREIARACDMSLGHLYYYIGSKQDILKFLISRSVEAIDQAVATSNSRRDPIRALEHGVEQYFKNCDRWQDWVLVGHRETVHLPDDVRDYLLQNERNLRDVFEALLKEAVRTGKAEVDDPALVARNIVNAGFMWALRRWELHRSYTLQDYTRQQIALLRKCLAVPSPAKNKPRAASKRRVTAVRRNAVTKR